MTDTFQPGDPAEQQIKKALRLADIILESSDPRTFIANMILHEKRLTDRTRPGEATPQKQETWEWFHDPAYYHLFCVRKAGETTFGQGFHVMSVDEAKALCELLNARADLPGDPKPADIK